MQVILQKDVKSLGYAGDIVSVKPGYARNFLFPKNWALPVSKGTKAQAQHQKQLIEAKKKKALALRMTLIDKLKGVKLDFKKEADTAGRLFGSVSAFAISKKLEEKNFEVDKRAIKLEKPLKLVGEHQVLVDMGNDLKTELVVNIIPIVSVKKTEEHSEGSKKPSKLAKFFKKTADVLSKATEAGASTESGGASTKVDASTKASASTESAKETEKKPEGDVSDKKENT